MADIYDGLIRVRGGVVTLRQLAASEQHPIALRDRSFSVADALEGQIVRVLSADTALAPHNEDQVSRLVEDFTGALGRGDLGISLDHAATLNSVLAGDPLIWPRRPPKR